MSAKKENSLLLSQAEHDQVQQLIANYQQLANDIHTSTNATEAEAALTPITTLSESVQAAFLKALVKENTVDAADVLVAINALGPSKELRKEARRGLIRLEAAKTYPQWTPPIVHTPAVQVHIPHPPRFWKGWVTQTREEGEMQLTLCWEQGYDYSEARLVAFELDFWQDGVKDCVVDAGSKRHIDELQTKQRSAMTDTSIVDCTLAEAKRLVEEALTINTWHGNRPHKNYRNHLPILNNLFMQKTTDLGQDSGRTFINPELEPQEVVVNFLGGWSMGDYGLAYDLLSKDSPVRDKLSRDAWIEVHRAWTAEAHPTRMELGFVHEYEHSQSVLWLPTSSIRSNTRKELGTGWSLELLDTPLSGTLKEMPMGTATNKDTGRHWFWTTYTLVKEQANWRIQQATDEGARAQGLSIVELQNRIKEHEEALQTKIEQQQQRPDTDNLEFIEEAAWRLTESLHYYDALIAHLPLDYHINEEAYKCAILTGNTERIQVYLERMAQRFPNNRIETLRRLGSIIANLAYKYDAPELRTRQQHLLTRSEEVLREAIAADQSAVSHTLLAEIFLSQGRSDDAQAELLKAREMKPGKKEEATIEAGLGNIAMQQKHMDDAILHYKRVIELDPKYPGIWFNLGFAYRLLGNFALAEASYQSAIQFEPNTIHPYSELIAIAMNQSDKQKARDIAEQAIHANPDSAHLHALFASVLFELGDRHAAQRQLEIAETIDPEQETVQSVREYMQKAKKK